MSTSTATGGVGGSGRPSPAVQDAPSSGATAEGSVPDTTYVTDAAVIAAGSADQVGPHHKTIIRSVARSELRYH